MAMYNKYLLQQLSQRNEEILYLRNEVQKTRNELSIIKSEYIKLKEQNAVYSLIEKIHHVFSKFTTKDELMNMITDSIIGIMGVPVSMVVLDQEDPEYYVQFYDTTNNGVYNLIKNNYEIIKRRLRNRNTLSISDLKEDVKISVFKGCLLVTKLEKDGKFYGIMGVYHTEKNFFTNTTINLFETISNQLIIYLENIYTTGEDRKDINIKDEFIDRITKLYNKTYLETKLELIKDNTYRSYSVILCEINNIKRIQIKYGTEAVNSVYSCFSNIAKKIFKNYKDNIFYYEKDKFVILLENIELKNTYTMADTLRKEFINKNFMFEQQKEKLELRVSISCYSDTLKIFHIKKLLYLAEKTLNYVKERQDNMIYLCTSKLTLLIAAEDAIKREITKSRRYKWDLAVFYIKFNILDNVDCENFYYEQMYNKFCDIFETTISGTDTLFKADDFSYILVTSNVVNIEILLKYIKNKFYKSELSCFEFSYTYKSFYYPAQGESFIEALDLDVKKIASFIN